MTTTTKESKSCIRCDQEKSLDDFYPNMSMASGRLNVCKKCHIADVAARRAAGKPRPRVPTVPSEPLGLPPILTTGEVASYLRCSTFSVRELVRRGKLKAFDIGLGKHRRFSRQAVMALVM